MSFIERNKYLIGATAFVVMIGFALLFSKKSKGANKVKLKNDSPKKILFVGDSVTAIKDYRTGKSITSTYPNMVRTALQPKGVSIDVLAKGGEATGWMLDNLKNQLAGNKYDRVYLYGGINDAWNNSIKPEKTMSNVNSMIDLVLSHGADMFIIQGYEPQGFMDINKMPVTRYQNSKQDNLPLIREYSEYQDALVKLQKERNDFSLVPKVNLGTRTGDGIHPNGEGQKMLAEAILKTI